MLPRKRPSNFIAQKKIFLVVTEGRNTEQDYFDKILNDLVSGWAYIKWLPAQKGTSPDKVLDRLQGYRGSIRPDDEQWAVCDRDRWTQEQRDVLLAWAQARPPKQAFRGVAVSTPMFELWLLLHFQPVTAPITAGAILKALEQHLPGIDKSEESLATHADKFTLASVQAAIAAAKALCPDTAPRTDRTSSNVWVLAEHILAAAPPSQFPTPQS